MYSKTDSGSDVAALLDRERLPSESYKTFAPSKAPRNEQPATVARREPERRAPEAPSAPLTPSDQPERLTDAPPVRPVVMEAAAKLLAQLGDEAAQERAAAAWSSLPSARAVAIAGVTGGAGATTLLASAASLLSRHGDRIVLADCGPSLLPFYFGGSSFRTAPSSFIPHRNAGSAAVHLVTGPAGAPTDEWLLHGIHEFQTEADRILIDCGAALSAEGSEWVWSAPATVLVLAPEPSSLLRLPAVLERSRRRPGDPPPAALLVNQYDAANSLHVDIRAALAQRFGEHLLPFVIRRDPAFSECLAAGGTVTELAPDSGAAADIRTFVDWLLNQGAHGRA